MAKFTEEKINAAWERAKAVPGYDSSKYRQDIAGAWMQKDKYGKEENYGWEVDHKFPASLGGNENNLNLQAMQWENNRKKADNFPRYQTAITSIGGNYKRTEQNWKFNDSFIILLKQLYPNNPYLIKLAA